MCEEKADGSFDEESLKEETLAFQIDYLGCKVSPTSKSLLEGLLTQDPEERLGQTLSGRSSSRSVRDITKHEFFESIKFSKLEDGEIESPFEPRVCRPSSAEHSFFSYKMFEMLVKLKMILMMERLYVHGVVSTASTGLRKKTVPRVVIVTDFFNRCIKQFLHCSK